MPDSLPGYFRPSYRTRRFVRLRSVATVSALLPALLTGGCSPVDALNATIPTKGVVITRDVAYGDGPRRTLDIYAPKDVPADAPVVVFFYGGAWQEGDKADYLFVAEALASRGIVAVVPDYRIYPEVTYTGFLDDGAAATAWVMHNIAKWQGDPRKIFVVGHSAGAYIAIMLALNPQFLAQAGVSANALAGAVGISGPYDFLPFRPDVRPIFEVVPDVMTTQPITFARRDAPKMLLVAGTADKIVDPANTTRLAEKIRSLGGKVTTKFYPGIGHVGTITALTPLFHGRASVLKDIDQFIHGNDTPQ